MRSSLRRRRGAAATRRFHLPVFEPLEPRVVLSIGMIELGPSDNIALDQPRVAVELLEDMDPDPMRENWRSLGPDYFNTFLLDTGANSVMVMASATGELDGFVIEGQFEELGVAGTHMLDTSAPYRFDYAGTSGIRHTIDPARVLSDAEVDFSQMGPWGIVGMPGMAGQVTSLDMTVWSGGGSGLELYMITEFRNDLPPSNGHRYALALDNRIAFYPEDSADPDDILPVWADVPFLTATPTVNGVERAGNFLFDTGGQMSVLSEHLAFELGLDSNGDGLLNSADDRFVTYQAVGGVGGEVSVPVFALDEVRITVTQVATGEEVELVWTDLEWLITEIDAGPDQLPLDGVFGADLLTSGWFYAFFYPDMPDGYIDQLYFDFRDWAIYDGTPQQRSGTVYFDLNESVDVVVPYGPGVRIRETDRTTEVIEGFQTDTYSISLTSIPSAPVQITVMADDQLLVSTDDGDTFHSSVIVTLNDKTPQTITVAGIQDEVPEGVHTGLITHTVASADPDYDNMSVRDVVVKVKDYRAIVHISSDPEGHHEIESIDIAEGAPEIAYWICLEEPVSDVTYVAVDYPQDQVYARNLRPPIPGLDFWWEFTPSNWDVPQQVLISAVDDNVPEGLHVVSVMHLAIDSSTFEILGETFLSVHITDNDAGSVLITESAGQTTITEDGGTDTYQIALSTTPTGPVQITVSADAQVQISLDGTSFTSALVLTLDDTTPRTVIVQAVDDNIDEGTHVGIISHAITGAVVDPKYPTSLPIAEVRATIIDNDQAGLRIAADAAGQVALDSISVVEGVAEQYWLVLTSEPRRDVTIFLGSDAGQVIAVDDAHPTNAFVLFTPLDWNVPQAVRVAAIADGIVEGPHTDRINHHLFSADPLYQGSVALPVYISDPPAAVVGRHIFYNNSAWDGKNGAANSADDNAIATDKQALVAGQQATFANYTSYSRGINGLMIDVVNLADPEGLSVADFEFRTGNHNNPDSWPLLALSPDQITITVRPGAGVDGSDRVTILLPDSAVRKTWLQVTMKATAATSLAAADVHYWGNAVGDSGNSQTDTAVNILDALGVRANLRSLLNPAPIDFRFDYNRDQQVNVLDELVVRANLTSLLTDLELLDLRGLGGGGEGEAEGEGEEREAAQGPDDRWSPMVGTLRPLTFGGGNAALPGTALSQVTRSMALLRPGPYLHASVALTVDAQLDLPTAIDPPRALGPQEAALAAAILHHPDRPRTDRSPGPRPLDAAPTNLRDPDVPVGFASSTGNAEQQDGSVVRPPRVAQLRASGEPHALDLALTELLAEWDLP